MPPSSFVSDQPQSAVVHLIVDTTVDLAPGSRRHYRVATQGIVWIGLLQNALRAWQQNVYASYAQGEGTMDDYRGFDGEPLQLVQLNGRYDSLTHHAVFARWRMGMIGLGESPATIRETLDVLIREAQTHRLTPEGMAAALKVYGALSGFDWAPDPGGIRSRVVPGSMYHFEVIPGTVLPRWGVPLPVPRTMPDPLLSISELPVQAGGCACLLRMAPQRVVAGFQQTKA